MWMKENSKRKDRKKAGKEGRKAIIEKKARRDEEIIGVNK